MSHHRHNSVCELLLFNNRTGIAAKFSVAIVLFLLLFSSSPFAQQPTGFEEKEIYLSIIYVNRQSDTVNVVVEHANGLGLKVEDEIVGWQAYKSEVANVSPERKMKEVGLGKINIADTVLSGFHLLRGAIKLYDASDSLEIGDFIVVKISVPKKATENIFAQLAFQDIIFYGNDTLPLYTVHDFVQADHVLPEDSVFKRLEISLPKSVAWLRTQTLNQTSREKMADGRFKGQYPLDVMEHMSRKDLRSFLMYVNDFPVGYQGHRFFFYYGLFGWVLVGGTAGATELKNVFLPIYKNKVFFEKQFALYKRDILSEDETIRNFVRDALSLSNNGKYQEAQALCDLALAIAYRLNDTTDLPMAHLIMAEIYQNKGQYLQAIQQCDKAAETSVKVENRDYELQALVKKAYCTINLSRFSEADNILALAIKKNNQYRSQISNDLFLRNSIKIFEELYYHNYKSGDYKKAGQFLDSVVAYDNMMNTHESALRNAKYYKYQGGVYNAQGQPVDALIVLNNALDIYRKNDDIASQAATENEMVSSFFKLSKYDSCIVYAKSAAGKYLKKKNYSDAAYSYSWIGQSQWNLGHYDSAIIAHNIALDYGRQAKDTFRLAWSWSKLGELYKLSGQKKFALSKLDTSVYYYSAIKDSSGLSEVYNQKGKVFLNDENYKTAIQFFEKAKGMSKADEEGLYNLGQAWRSVDTVKARKYFEDCRRQSIQDSNTYYHFESSRSLAKMAYYSKNFLAGQRYYNECLQISQQTKKPIDTAYCLMLKAYEYEMKVSLDSALSYYKKAADIFTRIDKSEKVYCLNDIASIFISTGEFAKADSLYQESMSLARSIPDQIALGNTLSASVFLYGRTGEFAKGLENSDSAFAIFRSSGNFIRLADAYFTRASLLGSSGEFKTSIQSYLTADSIYKAELITSSRSVIYNNIGVVYRNQKDYEKALKNFDLSLSLLPKGVVDESYLLGQGNKAECLHYLKRSKEAEALLLQVLPQATKLNLNRISSGMAVTMGDIYLAQKKFDEAKKYYSTALEYSLASGEKEKIIETLTGLGRINNETKNIDEAEKNFRQAVRVAEEMGGATGWESYYELGVIYLNRTKYDSAANYFKKAINLLEQNIENLFGGENAKKIFNNDPRKADLYNKITFSYFKLGDISSAWDYANRYNLAGLKELTGGISLNTPDKERNEALQKLFAMQKELQMLQTTADNQEGENKALTLQRKQVKEAEYTNFIDGLVNKYNDLGIYFNEINARKLKTYKKPIPDDMALLLYIQNDKTLMVISLTHENLTIDTISVEPSAEISSYIDLIKSGLLSVREGTVDALIKKTKDLSNKIYQMLIAPIDDSIKSKKRFCIIPTGIYSNLPFQCLGHYTKPGEFHYLIEDHVIFYATDASSVAKKEEPSIIKEDLVSFAAFGVPDEKLKYNLGEVQAIGKIVGCDSTTIYADQRATKSRAIESLSHKKIIHFATHGYLTYTSDLSDSYLKFVADKNDDGRLTIKEIGTLPIDDCNMVILSACQTAVSKSLTKGWNISPTNSFLLNNVRSVVASLWKVSDEPTGMLMQYFYNNLKSMTVVDKAEALRQAQLELMKDPRFSHPNFWGAFSLYGDWR